MADLDCYGFDNAVVVQTARRWKQAKPTEEIVLQPLTRGERKTVLRKGDPVEVYGGPHDGATVEWDKDKPERVLPTVKNEDPVYRVGKHPNGYKTYVWEGIQ